MEDVLADLDCSGIGRAARRRVLHDLVRPESFDVVVASNLFGDILTDLPAPSPARLASVPGEFGPHARQPVAFEPVHGSAPDIAGKGVANPVGAFLSAAKMLEWLAPSGGRPPPAPPSAAPSRSCSRRESTADAGGALGTSEVTEAVMGRI